MNDANRNTATNANLEQNSSDASLGANETKAFTSPVRVTFHHTRGRLADLDGLSGKAAIDGIVKAGILADDTPEQIKEIKHRQTKGKPEKTIITIEEME